MKIPNSKMLIMILIGFSIISCKKEINEKQNVKGIKEIVVQKTISKEKFQTQLFPKIKELYEKDKIKYRILNNIAEKAKNEKNPNIFKLQVNDIRHEMQFVH